MSKSISGIAIAVAMGLAAATSAQAQGTAQKLENSMQRSLKSVTSQPAAPLHGAMTQSQARKACQTELKGSKESRSALRTKMKFCVDQKMQGNN